MLAQIKKSFTILFVSLIFFLPIDASFAAGDGHHKHRKDGDIGKPGKRAEASRTITVTMFDNYFQPPILNLKEGETIHFVIKNSGDLVHEFGIATKEMHKAHIPEMAAMIEHGVIEGGTKINWDKAKSLQKKIGHGMHNEPNSVLLEPGGKGEIFWTFPRHTKLEFACNIPGHYEDGMVGKIHLNH